MGKGIEKNQEDLLIQELDKINFWGCKELKMGTALCAILVLYKDWNQGRYEYLKRSLGNIGKYKLIFDEKANNVPCFVLTSYNIIRTDQTEMFEKLTELFNTKYVIEAVKNRENSYDINLCILAIWFLQMRKLNITLLQKKIILLSMYLYYCEAKFIFSKITQRKNNIKVVAVFDDIFPIDNMVVQMCKNIGLKTVTFHHAIINGFYKYIEYRYSVADFFLAWGNYTRDVAIRNGMDENRIKVLGPINKIGETEIHAKILSERVFGVLTRCTSGNKYVDENIEMICMANIFAHKYGYKYILRVHPSDVHIKDYLKYVDKDIYIAGNRKDTLLDFIGKVEFNICGNTSAFAESLYYGKMCYRFIPEQEQKTDVCKGIRFGRITNLKQLEIKFNYDREKQNIEKRMKRVSDYIFENNAEYNYTKFFNEL